MVLDTSIRSPFCHLTRTLVRQHFMEFGHRDIFKLCKKNLSRERSICRNPLTRSFTGDRRNMTGTLNTLACYVFRTIYGQVIFVVLWTQRFYIRCVFNLVD